MNDTAGIYPAGIWIDCMYGLNCAAAVCVVYIAIGAVVEGTMFLSKASRFSADIPLLAAAEAASRFGRFTSWLCCRAAKLCNNAGSTVAAVDVEWLGMGPLGMAATVTVDALPWDDVVELDGGPLSLDDVKSNPAVWAFLFLFDDDFCALFMASAPGTDDPLTGKATPGMAGETL